MDIDPKLHSKCVVTFMAENEVQIYPGSGKNPLKTCCMRNNNEFWRSIQIQLQVNLGSKTQKKNLVSKTHGRSFLKMVFMGLRVFFFLSLGLRGTFLGLSDYAQWFLSKISQNWQFWKVYSLCFWSYHLSVFWYSISKNFRHILFNLCDQMFENENLCSKTHRRSILKTRVFDMGLRPEIYL